MLQIISKFQKFFVPENRFYNFQKLRIDLLDTISSMGTTSCTLPKLLLLILL